MEHYDVQVRSVDTTGEPHHVEEWTYHYVGGDYYGYTGEGDRKVEHLKRGAMRHVRVGGGEWRSQPVRDLAYVGFCEPLPLGLTDSGEGGSDSASPQSELTYARGDIEYRLVGIEEANGRRTKHYSTARPDAAEPQDGGGTDANPGLGLSDFVREELWVDEQGYIVLWARAIVLPAGDAVLTSYTIGEQSGFNETNVLPDAPLDGSPAVESVTATSVRISWDRLYVGDDYVNDMRVRYRHTVDDPWTFGAYVDIDTTGDPRPEATVQSLPCETGNQFLVEYMLNDRWHPYGITIGITSDCP